MPEDITVRILKEIRDGVADTNARLDQTNARLDQTNARLDQTNARLDQTREELGRRIVESELRTATAITEMAGAIRGVQELLKEQLDLRGRVEQCETEIRDLKRRVGA